MYKAILNLSLFIGFLAAFFVFFSNLLMLSLLLSLVGFIGSVFSIFYETKYQITKNIFTKSYLSLLLSSLPVLYVILIIFIFRH